jgi:hypothetical protein
VRIHAQVSISGQVLNDETGEVISNASVYINNTTIGFTTNVNGEYNLKGVRPGAYEIIVSHVSYEMILHRVVVSDKDMRYTFRLTPKVKQMRNIVVMTKDLRKEWMNLFRINFLGKTVAAGKSKIINEDDVLFEKGPTKMSMKAFSETPLIVENRELGYRIYFDLIEFFYDKEVGRTYYAGYSRFEELDDKNPPRKKWITNRQKIYLGSTMHFYHSLLNQDLGNQQFAIFISKEADSSSSGTTNLITQNNRESNMLSNQSRPRIAVSVTEKDILFREDSASARYYLNWKGQLHVRYKKDPYGKRHLQDQGIFQGMLPTGVQSGIDLLEQPAFLAVNGALDNPLAVQYFGYWANERMANLLPVDYSIPRN